MANQKAPITPPGNPAEIRSPTYREIYSNYSRVGLSPWDLSVLFGTVNETIAGKQQSVTTETVIKMSPHQFKALATSLPLILEQWETTFGEINLASQFLVTTEMLRGAFAALPPDLGLNKKST